VIWYDEIDFYPRVWWCKRRPETACGFLVKDGTLTDYFIARHPRETPHGDMRGKTHLTLRRTARNTEIDLILPYPPTDE